MVDGGGRGRTGGGGEFGGVPSTQPVPGEIPGEIDILECHHWCFDFLKYIQKCVNIMNLMHKFIH